MTEGWYRSYEITDLLKRTLGNDAVFAHNEAMGTIPPNTIEVVSDKTLISYPIGGPTTYVQLRGLLEQVRDMAVPPKKLLIPMIIDVNHFVSLFVMPNAKNPYNPSVAYINSFGKGNKEDDNVIQIVRETFNGANIQRSTTKMQYDGQSCGPITVDVLSTLAKINNPSELENAVRLYEASWPKNKGKAQEKALNLRIQQQNISASTPLADSPEMLPKTSSAAQNPPPSSSMDPSTSASPTVDNAKNKKNDNILSGILGSAALLGGGALIYNGAKAQNTSAESDTEISADAQDKPKQNTNNFAKVAKCVLGATVTLLGIGAITYAARGGSAAKPDTMNLFNFILKGAGGQNR